jgi:DNA-binding transcriptional MerR regulator
MPDGTIDIPNRALFKAAEVCDIVKVQPYVLRTWEAEFPDLGVAKTAGGPRIYRRADVEQVVRIKHLLLVEGLTLAGARRKLDDDIAPVAADAPVLDELMGRHARERLTAVKRGLLSILDLLAGRQSMEEFRLTGHPSAGRGRTISRTPPSSGRGKAVAPRAKASAPRNGHRRKART